MRGWTIIGCGVILAASQTQAGCAQDHAATKQTQTAASQRSAATSPESFVQAFYDWYVPRGLANQEGPAWAFVMRERATLLTPELAQALSEDVRAQAVADGELVGLDFDPFLASQDPCERYVAGQVTGGGRVSRIEVYSVCSGRRSERPDVIAEVVQRDGAWVFANFHYPREQTDLVTVLRQLRDSRQ
jgi:hypothetical protein